MAYVKGLHAALAVLEEAPERVRAVLVQKNRRDQRIAALLELAAQARVRHEFVDRRQLDRIAGAAHQGVVADCHELALLSEADFEERFDHWPDPKLFLLLEGINDPRNLGACIRSAVAAGVQAVLVPKRRSAPLNAAALKAAAGAAERAELFAIVNVARRLDWLKRRDVWVVGAEGDSGTPWANTDLTRSVALVVGSEGDGLRSLTRKTCDELAAIPMAGGVESLNVSVAAGVLLFEAVRQRTGREGAPVPAPRRASLATGGPPT
ncbi:MAG: 23S rRNA (guanosine(2251)-2'-O)-methyltransferase RlmB [Gammaproteobacteria bacterium]|nr:23S rRNA (guanosine(2251)-2'-O)-methyltransferase RlmB [Gammaproteobacteria bacterium]MDE0366954.1 23S rRNA (guanosine(2251)-2'-O)-methyltransferase RlmB [Gammaproteobacteria bacterium]